MANKRQADTPPTKLTAKQSGQQDFMHEPAAEIKQRTTFNLFIYLSLFM